MVVACTVMVWPTVAKGDVLGVAGSELRNDPLYVDPQLDRDRFVKADAARVRNLIRNTGAGRVYVAVLAPLQYEDPITAEEMARALAEFVREEGTYAVFVGDEFAAVSTELERGEASRLAARSLAEHGDEGIAATLRYFVTDLGPRVREQPFEAGGDFAPSDTGNNNSSLPLIAGIICAALALFGAGYLLGRR